MKHLLASLLSILAAFPQPIFSQNDKSVLGSTVLTPAQVAAGATITYLIRFQNLESDTAQSISIRDTLDPRLDATTLEMVDASHDYQILRGGGSEVRWFFNDIQLPDGDDPDSQGYILFRVKVKKGVFPGQVIRNRATIFFDGFQSVTTNEAVVWIDQFGASHVPFNHRLLVLPNPNSGQFETNLPPLPDGSFQFWISDLMGREVNFEVSENANSKRNTVRLLTSEPGLYIFQALTEEGILTAPFLVVK